MNFGLRFGIGQLGGRYINSYLVAYLMDTISTDDAMDRFLDNVGSNGSNNDALALASNHIYLNGTTQSVPYPILHELGSEQFNSLYSSASNVTIIDSGGGAYNIVDSAISGITGDSVVNIGLTTSLLAGKTYQISLDVTINSGSKRISHYYNGSATVPITAGVLTLVNGINIYEITMVADYYRHNIYTDIVTAYNIDFTVSNVKEITLPTASYFTLFDSTINTIKELSSTGDRGDILPVSTTYPVTDSHQIVFNHTAPLEDIDVSALEADPNLAFRMFFDGEILPSGFSRADDMVDCNFFGGNEGKNAYVQDLSEALGADISTGVLDEGGTEIVVTNLGSGLYNAARVNVVSAFNYLRFVLDATYDTIVIIEFEATINSGTFNARQWYDGSGAHAIDPNIPIVNGTNKILIGTSSAVPELYMYPLIDEAFDIDITITSVKEVSVVEIQDYDSTCLTTLANQSNGASNLKLIRDGSGRTTGTALANTTQWESDGRTAVTNWTITAPFTVAEIIDGDTYLFTSDGNRFKNLIADGTYTVPTGIWTLDEFGFDGVTPVTARGGTGMIDEVIA